MTVTADPAPLGFDSDFLRRLERLELLAKKMIRGLMRGERSSTHRGRGLEFTDFRQYRPGDDFRHIDWNLYSRLDQLFLKLYAAEEDLTLHLLLDASASMGFGNPKKFDFARRLAAALAYIGLSNMDRVGLLTFSNQLGASLPALKAKHHMATLLEFLSNLPCAGETRFKDALAEFALRNRRPGLVIVISDFLGVDNAQLELDVLRRHGHSVVALQLLAEDEINPPLDGALTLIDSEDGSELKVTVDHELRELYLAGLKRTLSEFETFCRRQGIDYLRTSTSLPFEEVVFNYLRRGTFLP